MATIGLPEGLRIGDFLVIKKIMSSSDVNKVLAKQANGDKLRFGEIAIEMGLIDDNALRQYVEYHEPGGKKAAI
jgi:hypothetical protein